MKKNFFIIMLFLLIGFHAYSQTADFSFTKVCLGDTTMLINTSQSSEPIINVDWDFMENGLFNDASGDTIKRKFVLPGIYNIGMRITTQSNIQKAIYKQVLVGAFPIANFETQNACAGELTDFDNTTVLSTNDIENYIWSFGDGSPNEYSMNPTHYYNGIGIYNVKMLAISSAGCSDSITKNVEIMPIPDLSFTYSGDTILTEGNNLTVTAIGDFDEINWSTGEITNNILINQGGFYFAQVFKNGCSANKSFVIVIKERHGIANILTPNGDGFNDTWNIFHIDNIGPCQVSIYNRGGTEVFVSSDYRNSWDGTYKGKPLPEGTYYYIIKCADEIENRGPVSIIR